MKKYISMFVALVLAFSLCACGGSDKDSDKGSSSSTNVSVSHEDVVYINDAGESTYSIIRPANGELDEVKVSTTVYKQAKEILGVNMRNGADDTDGTDAFEILIGQTNRPESQQALDFLDSKTGGRYNDYVICTIGKKIVINAVSAGALEKACNYFVENFMKKEGIKGGIEYTYGEEGDWEIYSINGVNIKKFTIVRPHFNSSYLTQLEMEEMVDTIFEKTGHLLKIVDDEYVEPGEYEIVVGNTNRDGIKKVSGYETYDISVSGKKVYLNGGSAHSTSMAVSEFAKMLYAGDVTDANTVNNADYNQALNKYDLKTTYRPVYFDNFDGDTIDSTKWRLMKGSEFRKDGQNGKLSGMTDNPQYVYQKDGCFYIYGHEDEHSYYGGTLVNNKTMRFHYGYVEHSVICPDGDGFWSLLWFDNRGDADNVLFGAEIDLNECFGNGSVTQPNCHKWPTALGVEQGYEHVSLDKEYGAQKKYYHPDDGTWADGFHTFGFLWDATQMSFTADGKIFFSYDITRTPEDIDAFVNANLYMKLSYSVGRYNNNLLVNNLTDYEWQNTNVLCCDWIYLYQFDDGIQFVEYK